MPDTPTYSETRPRAQDQHRYRQPRDSMDSTAHLLPSTTTPRTSRPPSIAPSISSVLSDTSTLNAPAWQQRGFKSREAYVAALNEFAESKLFMEEGHHTLQGWYGTKTMDDYKSRLSLREERKLRKAKEQSEKQRQGRRATMASVEEEIGSSQVLSNPQHEQVEALLTVDTKEEKKESRMRRLSRAFSGGRRATVV